MCNVCLRLFPVRGKKLTLGGNTYQSTTGGSTTQTFANGSCQTSQDTEGAMWRIDFDNLIEVYAIEITPGMLLM